MTDGALAGLSVLEVGSLVAAPYCGKMLADLGADGVKVEAPETGDPARRRARLSPAAFRIGLGWKPAVSGRPATEGRPKKSDPVPSMLPRGPINYILS